jgi:hypothetical protein
MKIRIRLTKNDHYTLQEFFYLENGEWIKAEIEIIDNRTKKDNKSFLQKLFKK